MDPVFPFTAVVAQEEYKRALLLCAVDPSIGGVLAFGDRGTGKSTTVRGLGALLLRAGLATPVVDLPLGATEDRLIGSIDIDAALATGERRFQPGLLAAAHGGFLYVDEVNLLDDYLVDLLLDVAASGVNVVEREGISHSHPAQFVLVGSGNPDEGDLRPQLEDRFGLSCWVRTVADVPTRVEIVRRRLGFQADPAAFVQRYAASEEELAQRVAAARARAATPLPEPIVEMAVRVAVAAGAEGHRGEIVLARAARALACLDGVPAGAAHIRACAALALRRRIPRDAFDEPADTDARVAEAVLAALADG